MSLFFQHFSKLCWRDVCSEKEQQTNEKKEKLVIKINRRRV